MLILLTFEQNTLLYAGKEMPKPRGTPPRKIRAEAAGEENLVDIDV